MNLLFPNSVYIVIVFDIHTISVLGTEAVHLHKICKILLDEKKIEQIRRFITEVPSSEFILTSFSELGQIIFLTKYNNH